MSRLYLLCLLAVLSCGAPTRDELLDHYLKERIGLDEERFPKLIVVVSEDDCIHCDRAFADLVRPRTSLPNCLFIVRLEGGGVDMHGFMNETAQMRFDDDLSFKRLGILPGSGVIVMDGPEIDTVIAVELDGIEQRLLHIKTLLNPVDLQQ